MRPRIKGLETEYSIKLKKPCELTDKRISRQTLNNPAGIVGGGFLPNGGRYYLDTSDYPEFATPECLTVKDIIRFDKAGEKILTNDFSHSQFSLSLQKANYGIGQEGFFNLKSGTRGCHENYLVDERLLTPRNNPPVLALMLFLISRQIIAGRGGLILSNKGKICPVISKRAFVIQDYINNATTNDRAIICTAKQNESYSYYGRRFHLILGDSNLSEYSTFLKIGTTDLILTLLENDFLPPLLTDNPLKMLREISFDIKMKHAYEVIMASGRRKKFNAIDIQFWYLDLARKFFSKAVKPTDEEKFILNLWQETLDALKRDPMSLSDRLDYLIVLRLFEEAKNILGSSLNDEQLKQIDFNYSELLPGKSWYLKQIKMENIKRLLTDDEINWAVNNPPNNTRAKLRGEFIKMLLSEKIAEHFTINWDQIYFNTLQKVWPIVRQIILTPIGYNKLQALNLKNPFQTESDKYNAFKDMVSSMAEKLRELSKEKSNQKAIGGFD